MILDRGDFRRSVVYPAAVVGNVVLVCTCSGKPADVSQGIAEIHIAEAVAVVGVIEELVTALDKVQGLLRLYPGLVLFRENGAHVGAV